MLQLEKPFQSFVLINPGNPADLRSVNASRCGESDVLQLFSAGRRREQVQPEASVDVNHLQELHAEQMRPVSLQKRKVWHHSTTCLLPNVLHLKYCLSVRKVVFCISMCDYRMKLDTGDITHHSNTLILNTTHTSKTHFAFNLKCHTWRFQMKYCNFTFSYQCSPSNVAQKAADAKLFMVNLNKAANSVNAWRWQYIYIFI